MAEGEGFEPSVPYWTRRLSRAVHSTTLPPFREAPHRFLSSGTVVYSPKQPSWGRRRMRIIYRTFPVVLLQTHCFCEFTASVL